MISISYSYSKAQYFAETEMGVEMATYQTLGEAVADLDASGDAYEVTESAQDQGLLEV